MASAAGAAGSSRFSAFMNHPAGPRTVFFWAPMMKWCLVAAGIKDLTRPPEKLSVPQNLALAATGMIWVRYSLVITPVNYSLATVNFVVGSTGIAQLYRIWNYNRTIGAAPAPSALLADAQHKGESLAHDARAKASEIKEVAQEKFAEVKSKA
ncbi:UPF0041-domain-containing protein [Tilletiopsis washingtonensis]|uniref:Mitochondrial pyruvate carrier n=1 Tax=Tilletiopsis washingtonensis TaxID=58919 RepID=A0A316Z5M0_9BASI|nr:UPF0041-domain-containing protein [Tilletiopsis washingtonensis]PWN97077.1 UPF0041-domain-containing protein [Tilletiopsis washingtonensis]